MLLKLYLTLKICHWTVKLTDKYIALVTLMAVKSFSSNSFIYEKFLKISWLIDLNHQHYCMTASFISLTTLAFHPGPRTDTKMDLFNLPFNLPSLYEKYPRAINRSVWGFERETCLTISSKFGHF